MGASRKNLTLKELKDLPEFIRDDLLEDQSRFDLSLSIIGVPKGALTHLEGPLGGGKTAVVLKLLAENPAANVAWVEEEFTAYPCAFGQNQVSLDRVLFVETLLEKSEWVLLRMLKSQIFQIIVFGGEQSFTEKALRRFQLLLKQSGSSLIFLSHQPMVESKSWVFSMRLRVDRSPGEEQLCIRLLKSRRHAAYERSV